MLPVSHNGIAQDWNSWPFGHRGSIPRAGVMTQQIIRAKPEVRYKTEVEHFLPTKSLVFVDTSALGIHQDNWEKERRMYFIKLRERMVNLIHAFEGRTNIRTTKEVLGEMLEGIKGLESIVDGSKPGTHEGVKRTLVLKKQLYKILRKKGVNVNFDEPAELCGWVGELLPRVERIFIEERGVLKPPYTDTRLIAHALVYAKRTETGIFSRDRPLMQTFARYAMELDLPDTFVCEGVAEKIYHTSKYGRNSKPN